MGQKVNVKFFVVDPYSVGTGVPRTFLELGKIQKNIFLKIKTSIIKSENIYQRIHNTGFIFYFFGIFTIFFVFFPIFFKKNVFFLKKLQISLAASTANQVHFLGGLAIFHTPPTSDLVWKIAKPPKKCTWLAVEAAN